MSCFAFTARAARNSPAFTAFEIFVLVLFAPLMLKFVVSLSIALWYPIAEQRRERRRSANPAPKVSVLIPAWNEEVGIAAAMISVVQANYPDLEVIVIDDGSTDGTFEQIEQVAARFRSSRQFGHREIRFRRVRNGGKARALNTALKLATGEIVVTIDADSLVERHAIGNLVKHFADPKVASVAGNVAIGNRNTCIGLVQQLEYLFGFYFKRAEGMLNAVYIVGGAAAAYRRSILVEVGGFDETIITEDIELDASENLSGSVLLAIIPSCVRGFGEARRAWRVSGRLGSGTSSIGWVSFRSGGDSRSRSWRRRRTSRSSGPILDAALGPRERAKGGRPSFELVLKSFGCWCCRRCTGCRWRTRSSWWPTG